MKHFFSNLFTFLGFFLLVVFLYVSILLYVNKNYRNSIKLSNNISTVVLGDSHIECAINDKHLSNTKNLAASAESYYFSFYKLKEVHRQNPHIKKVYLGFGYHAISSYYDKYIIGEKAIGVAYKYYYYLPPNEQLFLVINSSEKHALIKSLLEKGTKLLLKNDNKEFVGGFYNGFKNTEVKPKAMSDRLQRQYYADGKILGLAEINLEYFDSIINFCRTNNLKLTLINTLLHPEYEKKTPAFFKVKSDSIIRAKKLPVINFNGLKLSDNHFIPDGDHVSSEGAELTTQWLLKKDFN